MSGVITGKTSIYKFTILIHSDIEHMDFIKVVHPLHGDVLGQVLNVEHNGNHLVGYCRVIGYREGNNIQMIRIPFAPETQVVKAEDKFIASILGIIESHDAFIGTLDNHEDIKVTLDLQNILSKHVALLAKTGAGKSYTVGVLLEEVISRKIPVIILDPHGEYSSLKYPNTKQNDISHLKSLQLESKGFFEQVQEYTPDPIINPEGKKLTLDVHKLSQAEFVETLQQKLTGGQVNLLYEIINKLGTIDVDALLLDIAESDNVNKWAVINALQDWKKMQLFSVDATPLREVVKTGAVSIVNLKGVQLEIQELFVEWFLRYLFDARKKEEIPPFLLVVEEAHNYCPERNLGEVRSSKIIRTLASEGRKFGAGLCVVSQRPAKVDKNVLSQCYTQIILKVTNPLDLKAISSSSEGAFDGIEEEIQRLPIGTAIVTGVISYPLKVHIRPRKTKHGGETVNILSGGSGSDTGAEENNKTPDIMNIVDIGIDHEDARVILEAEKVKTMLLPAVCAHIKSGEDEFKMVIELQTGKIIVKPFPLQTITIPPEIYHLQGDEIRALKKLLLVPQMFNAAELFLKAEMPYGQAVQLCERFAQKNVLSKDETGGETKYNAWKLNELKKQTTFVGNIGFKQMQYDEIIKTQVSFEKVKEVLELFGIVQSVQEVTIPMYQAV